jgi:hypothetical protein
MAMRDFPPRDITPQEIHDLDELEAAASTITRSIVKHWKECPITPRRACLGHVAFEVLGSLPPDALLMLCEELAVQVAERQWEETHG